MTRIAIVSGILIRHDAISNVMVQQYRVLTAAGYDCSLYVHHVGDDVDADLDVVEVGDSWHLARDEGYRAADVVVFHFGIHYDLFNALLLDHPRARRVVHFHNVTPPDLLTGLTRRAAFDGLLQVAIADRADAVWSDSPHNTETLLAHSAVDPAVVVPMELCVPEMDEVVAAADRPHPHDPVVVLAVGRFVEAKGQLDLIRAVEGLPPEMGERVRCVLAGSPANSDSVYLRDLQRRIADRHLQADVEFRLDPLDDELIELFAEADVFVAASYHEGFCVPVVEALATGCRVVATNAGALVDTVGGHGRHVGPGDVDALTAVLAEEVAAVLASRVAGSSAEAHDRVRRTAARMYVVRFAPAAFGERTVAAVEALLGPRPAQ